MTWPFARLDCVASIQLGKMLSPRARSGSNLAPYLRNANIQWGHITVSDLAVMNFDEGDRKKFELKANDLLVCEGGEPGRCAVVSTEVTNIYFQKSLIRVRPFSDRLESRFLQRYMAHLADRGHFDRDGNAATIAHFPAVRLAALKVPVPPLREQVRIADLLDKVDAIRRKRQEAIALTDDLLRSTFLEMFGDPVTNPKGWPVVPLGDLADATSGVAKGKNYTGQPLVTVPYMRVANVQDGHIDLAEVKTITVTPDEATRYRLEVGDLLLTEGGDPDKLGRGAVWQGVVADCIHQNHIFRVRPGPRARPQFLSALIGSARGKRYFLQAAKQTTGIATINMGQLRSFPCLAPPLSLQDRYTALVDRYGMTRHLLQLQARDTDSLRDTLLYEAFSSPT